MNPKILVSCFHKCKQVFKCPVHFHKFKFIRMQNIEYHNVKWSEFGTATVTATSGCGKAREMIPIVFIIIISFRSRLDGNWTKTRKTKKKHYFQHWRTRANTDPMKDFHVWCRTVATLRFATLFHAHFVSDRPFFLSLCVCLFQFVSSE